MAPLPTSFENGPSKRFWFSLILHLSAFTFFATVPSILFPIIVITESLFLIVVGWLFGIRTGLLVGIGLAILRRLLLAPTLVTSTTEATTAFQQFFPAILIIGLLIPTFSSIAAGWAGERLREVQQLSTELLYERQQLQLEVQRRQEAITVAEEANQAKSIFLANMSHELRTPLAVIVGYNELVRERLGPNSNLAVYLNKSLDSATHLQNIIDDILALSRIESNRLTLAEEPFSLQSCLITLLNTMSIKSEAKGLYLQYEVKPNTPDALIGDNIHLQQVLINLLDNGIKFTEKGGVTLTVRAERQTETQTHLHFTVKDTGKGIAVADQAHIFEIFNQVEQARKKQQAGAGLGLTISNHLITAMGGHIEVESEIGQGATFTFTIRAKRPPKGSHFHTNGVISHQLS